MAKDEAMSQVVKKSKIGCLLGLGGAMSISLMTAVLIHVVGWVNHCRVLDFSLMLMHGFLMMTMLVFVCIAILLVSRLAFFKNTSSCIAFVLVPVVIANLLWTILALPTQFKRTHFENFIVSPMPSGVRLLEVSGGFGMDGFINISFCTEPADFDQLRIAFDQKLLNLGFNKKDKDALMDSFEPCNAQSMTDPEFEHWERCNGPDDPEPDTVLLVVDKQHRNVRIHRGW